MKDRLFFEAGNDDIGVQVIATKGSDLAYISCNDEWCGSTDTGFGATVGVNINREDAKKLIDMLSDWLEITNLRSTQARIPDIFKNYEGGTCIGKINDDYGSLQLHYKTFADAQAAFEAITDAAPSYQEEYNSKRILMKTITYDETQWKLVPIICTTEMQQAGKFELHNPLWDEADYSRICSIFRAMIAAAPQYQEE